MIDQISQIDLNQKDVRLTLSQKQEVEARRVCANAVRLRRDGRISASPSDWLKRDLARALNEWGTLKEAHEAALRDWERWGKERKERKPVLMRAPERAVQVLARAVELCERGYPDEHNPGSVLAY